MCGLTYLHADYYTRHIGGAEILQDTDPTFGVVRRSVNKKESGSAVS